MQKVHFRIKVIYFPRPWDFKQFLIIDSWRMWNNSIVFSVDLSGSVSTCFISIRLQIFVYTTFEDQSIKIFKKKFGQHWNTHISIIWITILLALHTSSVGLDIYHTHWNQGTEKYKPYVSGLNDYHRSYNLPDRPN